MTRPYPFITLYLSPEDWRSPVIRQACRRAALSCWQEARYLVGSSDPDDHRVAWFALMDCINFRAAARAK